MTNWPLVHYVPPEPSVNVRRRENVCLFALSRSYIARLDELLHLTTICGVRLADPGVVERILKNDATVCSKSNPIGFRKLRALLMATFGSLNEPIDRIGPEQTKQLVESIIERNGRQRDLGGTGSSK